MGDAGGSVVRVKATPQVSSAHETFSMGDSDELYGEHFTYIRVSDGEKSWSFKYVMRRAPDVRADREYTFVIDTAADELLAVYHGVEAVYPSSETDALGAELRALRKQPRHGMEKWGARRHELMGRLARSLGDGKHTRQRVIEVMGPPDRTAKPDDSLWKLAGPSDGSTELLIYEWRGLHDFLYFELTSDGTVSGSGWWMAGE